MNFTPLGERVLLERKPAELKTATGLIIPDTSGKKNEQALVLALGDGVSTPIPLGSIVLVPQFCGTEFKLDGKDVLIVNYKDILGVINV